MYTASAGIIILLLLSAIGFYLMYRALIAAQVFFYRGAAVINGFQLVKTGTAVTIYKILGTIINRLRRGGE